jgi:hypothetical protein
VHNYVGAGTVLLVTIFNQCCGSGIFIPDPNFSIPNPGSKRFLIPDPHQHQRINVFLTKKLFLSSRKYGPGCSPRIQIPDPDLDFIPIPDPGSRVQKDTESQIRIRNTDFYDIIIQNFNFLLKRYKSVTMQ